MFRAQHRYALGKSGPSSCLQSSHPKLLTSSYLCCSWHQQMPVHTPLPVKVSQLKVNSLNQNQVLWMLICTLYPDPMFCLMLCAWKVSLFFTTSTPIIVSFLTCLWSGHSSICWLFPFLPLLAFFACLCFRGYPSSQNVEMLLAFFGRHCRGLPRACHGFHSISAKKKNIWTILHPSQSKLKELFAFRLFFFSKWTWFISISN